MMFDIKKLVALILVMIFAISGCSSDEEKKASHYDKGRVYFEQGEYKSAELELKNAVQIDPEYTEAYLSLGETYMKLGDLQGAFSNYRRVAELDQNNLDVRLKLATFYMLGRNVSEARKAVDFILAKEPNHLEALYVLASIHAIEKKPVEATVVYEKILELDSYAIRAWTGLARMALLQGDKEKAQGLLDKAVGIDPDAVKPRLALFELYARDGEFQKAESLMQATIERKPEDPNLRLVLGNLYFGRKMQAKAEASYRQAIELDPENVKSHMALAGFYNAIGRKDKALEAYLKALEIDPENVRTLSTVARFYYESKDIYNSQNYIKQVLDKRPNYYPMRMLAGEIQIAQKEFTKAIATFNSLIKEEPRAAIAYYFKGVAHLGIAEGDQAKTEIAKALELNPKLLKARLLLANIHLRSRDFRLAQKEAEEILKLAPGAYPAALVRGNALFLQRKPKEAEAAFKALIKLDPENPVGYYRLGQLYRLTRRYDLAMANLDKALVRNPLMIDAFSNMILIHVARKEFAVAMDKCDLKLIETEESPVLSAYIYNMKGGLYLAERKYPEAEQSFVTALEKNPNYLKPYYALSRLYHEQGKHDASIQQFKTILEKKPKQTRPHMMLGTIFENRNQLDLAEKHYRAALTINPDFAPAANNLAYLLSSQEQTIDEALTFAKQAKAKLPTDPNVADTLGWVYYHKGLYDMAIGEFSDSIKKLPDNPIVHYHLGLALHKKGDLPAARAELERALSLNDGFEGADEARRLLAEI